MPSELLVGCGVSSAVAVLVTWWALRPFRRDPKSGKRERVKGLRRLPVATSFVLFAVLLLTIAVGLRGFEALTHEERAGTIVITRAGAEPRFVATWMPAAGPVKKAVLTGDQIQVDAQILKWAPWANVLGLHTQFAVRRVTGRYASAAKHNAKPPKTVAVTAPPIVDIFALARALPAFVPVVDATYGSSSFVRANDGARWDVFVSTSGLLMRPQR